VQADLPVSYVANPLISSREYRKGQAFNRMLKDCTRLRIALENHLRSLRLFNVAMAVDVVITKPEHKEHAQY
jgi:hypothetical protein